jgi:hypothetical protein
MEAARIGHRDQAPQRSYVQHLRALREEPTTHEAIGAMLRATADTITAPQTPTGCMLILAAATGSTHNSDVRAFLTDLRRDMFDTIRARLERGVTDRDLPTPTAPLLHHRRPRTVDTGPRRRHPHRPRDRDQLRDGHLGHPAHRTRPAPVT